MQKENLNGRLPLRPLGSQLDPLSLERVDPVSDLGLVSFQSDDAIRVVERPCLQGRQLGFQGGELGAALVVRLRFAQGQVAQNFFCCLPVLGQVTKLL